MNINDKTKKYFIFTTLIVMVFLANYYIDALDKSSYFKQGKIDLSETDFARKGFIELNGEWEFYWNELLETDDFISKDETDIHYTDVPGKWTKDKQGNIYDKRGYATYRMIIFNIPEWKKFAMKKGNIRNSSKIYVNGKFLFEDGVVSKDLEGSIGENNSEVIYFELEESTAEIIIQVANHEYIVGGIAKPIIFGDQRLITRQHIQKISFEIAIILVLIIIGLFYTGLFLTSKYYRTKELATLPLALSCLFFGFTNSIYSERIISIVFPEITMTSIFRFGHIMTVFSMLMVLLVINKVNKIFLSNRILSILIIFYSTFFLCVITLPLHIYLKTLNFYMGSAIVIHFALWLWIFVLFLKKDFTLSNPVEHRILVVSIFSIFLYWVDLTLYSTGVTSEMFISFLAVAVYSVSLSILLISRYVISYKKNEELSIKLIETFSTLDQTTREVERNELAFLQAQIKPHFLFNALSSIISLCYTDPDKAAKLLTNLSGYLKRSFDIDLKTEFVTIENELKLIKAYVDIQIARFEDRIQMSYDIDEDVLPLRIPPLFIEPLVENAIKHGVLQNKNGGRIKLIIRKYKEYIYVCVEDNGIGMDKEQIKAIKDKGKSTLHSSKGNGISLMNISSRLRSMYGAELNFDTTQNGTKIYFSIPII